jgi:hypothetical protein
VPASVLAAKYRNSVPTSAIVTPNELMIMYFQAASSDTALASRPTSTQLASVLPSMSTHSSPRLPVSNEASIIDAKIAKKMKYRRTCSGPSSRRSSWERR